MTKSEIDLRRELEERLRFETLLTDISTRFINLPAEQIDGGIEDAQRRVCKCLGLDLSALWQWSTESQRFLELTHLYSPPEGPSRPERIVAEESFPWSFRKLMQGETLAYSTEDLPPSGARDKETRRYYGVKSTLAIPLSVGGGPFIGVLSFDTLHEERTWPSPLVRKLQLVAQIFTNALARKYAEHELRESEARLTLATDAAGAGLWSMTYDTGHVWTTPKTRELFHFAPDEALSLESFLKVILPADREQVRQAVAQARRSGEKFNIEYRVMLPDGSIRWIAASGRSHRRSEEEPDCLMGVSTDISGFKQMEDELHDRLKEIETLKRRPQNENLYLRRELRMEKGFEKIVGESKAFESVIFSVKQV